MTVSHTTVAEQATDATVRWAGGIGLATAAAFPVVVVVAGTGFDGYSHVSQKISELGGVEATTPWIQNANFSLLGLGALAIAVGLWRSHVAFRIGAALVGAFAVLGAVLQAVFPCDAGCAGATPTGLAHIVLGATGFIAVTAAMFVLPKAWDDRGSWSRLARTTRAVRPVTVAGFLWFIGTQALDAQALAGVAQRLFAASVVAWLAIVGWELARHRPQTGEPQL